MFPEDFAREWIQRLTKRGEVVFDPFCGRGTTPFEAILNGRMGVGSDINPVAYCVTAAKLNPPRHTQLLERLDALERSAWQQTVAELPEFFGFAFTPGVLRQISFLRTNLRWKANRTDRMIAATILGILHGESMRSARYLSNQMPRTIATKPAYSIKYWKRHGHLAPERDVFDALRREIRFRYESALPGTSGAAYLADFRDMPRLLRASKLRPRLVVMSPPYLDTTRFEEDQWLRLWFLGNAPHPTYGHLSRDDRYDTPAGYWRLIADMWRVLGVVLAPRSNVIIRIGARRMSEEQITDGLAASAAFSGRKVRLVSWSVSDIRRKQHQAFRPQVAGCRVEVDCHFSVP